MNNKYNTIIINEWMEKELKTKEKNRISPKDLTSELSEWIVENEYRKARKKEKNIWQFEEEEKLEENKNKKGTRDT